MIGASIIVWFVLNGNAKIPRIYVDMCHRAPSDHYQYENGYAFVKREGECFIWQRNVGQVYWQDKSGAAIVSPWKGAQ